MKASACRRNASRACHRMIHLHVSLCLLLWQVAWRLCHGHAAPLQPWAQPCRMSWTCHGPVRMLLGPCCHACFACCLLVPHSEPHPRRAPPTLIHRSVRPRTDIEKLVFGKSACGVHLDGDYQHLQRTSDFLVCTCGRPVVQGMLASASAPRNPWLHVLENARLTAFAHHQQPGGFMCVWI